MTWEITETTKGVEVSTPYNPGFVKQVRNLGGKWDPDRKAWTVRTEVKDKLEEVTKRYFGNPATGLVDLVVSPSAYDLSGRNFFCYGMPLAYRPSRDYSVKLADNVAVIGGGFPSSGGSVKNPRIEGYAGTVFRIFDVPADLIYRYPKTTNKMLLRVIDKNTPTESNPDPDQKRAELVDAIKAKKAELEALIAELKALNGDDLLLEGEEEDGEEITLEDDSDPMRAIALAGGMDTPTDLGGLAQDIKHNIAVLGACYNAAPQQFADFLRAGGVYAEHCRPMKNAEKWIEKLARKAADGGLVRRNKRRG